MVILFVIFFGCHSHIVSQSIIDNLVEVIPNRVEADKFFIGRFAVTNEEWNEFIKATNRQAPRYWKDGRIPTGRENHPVLWISAKDGSDYCSWLSEKYPEWTFYIPTEAEWVSAAIGNSHVNYPWGNNSEIEYRDGRIYTKFNCNAVIAAKILETPDMLLTFNNPKSTRYNESITAKNLISISERGAVSGWIDHKSYTGFVYTDIFTDINNNGGYTVPVDAFPEGTSYCGAYNMCGNCWEWTSTIAEAQNGAEKGQMVNVIKGGSWYATASSCRATFEGEGRKGTGKYATVGLRIAARLGKSGAVNPIISDTDDSEQLYYAPDGRMLKKPQRGVTIVKPRRGNIYKILR